MGERHDAEHSVAQARQRLSEIAEELSRRASGDYVRDRAREMADDLSARAKVKARERSVEMKDRLLDSPWALGLIGGTVGAIAGKLLGDRTRESRKSSQDEEKYYGRGAAYGAGTYQDRPYDEWTATHSPYESSEIITDDRMYGLDRTTGEHVGFEGTFEQRFEGEESHGRMDAVKDKASELKDRASNLGSKAKHAVSDRIPSGGEMKGRASNMGSRAKHAVSDRIPSGGRIKERASHARDYMSADKLRGGMSRVKHNTDEHSGMWALGALIAGAVFGAMMPVSNRERQMLAPAKGAAADEFRHLKHGAMDRVKDVKEKVQESIGMSGEEHEEEPAPSFNGGGERGYHASSEGAGSTGGYNAGGYTASADEESGSFSSSPGTFTSGGVEGRKEGEEGGVWTASPDPDVTRH